MSKNQNSKNKKQSGKMKKHNQSKQNEYPVLNEREPNTENDFYVICGDCGGLGRIIITGTPDDGVNIIY